MKMKPRFGFFRCFLCFISLVLFSTGVSAQELVYWIEIINKWNMNKLDEPVVLKLKDMEFDFDVSSAIIWDGENEIASQLDDLDGNGKSDELTFVIDMPASSEKNLRIELSSVNKQKNYPTRVYAEMMISDFKGKHIPISSLTIPASSYVEFTE